MGNRTGSPPEQYRDDNEELTENQPEADDTQQTGIGDITQPESEDEEPPSTDADIADDSDKTRGGGGGGVIEMPTGSESDDTPQEDDESDEADQEGEHSEAEEAPEPDSGSEESENTEGDEPDEFEFVYGDIVCDRETEPPEDEVPEDLVVVNLPDGEIDDWNYSDDETLADRNPGYPPTDSVVVVVIRDALREEMPEWDERVEEIPLETLDHNSIDYSCHPSLRLELEDPSHLRGP